MQVKKFEAKSMQEALNLIKLELGPEAIILSARDNSRGFGLAGKKSVEVTAAVSEETLRNKRMAEAKLNERIRSQYQQAPARIQKHFIDKALRSSQIEIPKVREQRPMTQRPYIDIDDGEQAQAPRSSQAQQASRNPQTQRDSAEARIKNAAKRAAEVFQDTENAAQVRARREALKKQAEMANGAQIATLQSEIEQLKNVIKNFKEIPQSFVTLHPGADHGLSYPLSAMYQKLTKAGVQVPLAVKILKAAGENLSQEQLEKPAMIDAWVAKHIMDSVQIAERRTDARYHMFLGASGQGKTSSLVKLASHLVICEKKKVAILTTDSIKVGSAEQLRIYAQILNVPFAIVRKKSDWAVIEEKLSGMDHILVDYPGMNLRSMGEMDWLRDLTTPKTGGRAIHFVQSVLAKDEDALETAARFKMVGIDDVIFTGLDQAVRHGLILNFQEKFQTPLHSFSIGEQIPEDFEPATKERVIDLLFKISRIKKERGQA